VFQRRFGFRRKTVIGPALLVLVDPSPVYSSAKQSSTGFLKDQHLCSQNRSNDLLKAYATNRNPAILNHTLGTDRAD
jgi:hypothetical protein